MRVFEFHFNPGKTDDRIFNSFVYEPDLCMAGELTQAMPQNKNLIRELSDVIRNNFYGGKNFEECLGSTNDFLDKETKSGNVNWLGNLNFAVVNIKDSILNFTKAGDVKILLLRNGEILDIGQNLELQDAEPYPMKVFSNIASGKLLNRDKIFISTGEIFSIISRNKYFWNQLAAVNKESDLKKVFHLQKNVLLETSGMCLLITDINNISTAIPAVGMPAIRIPTLRVPTKILLIISLIVILTAASFIFKGNLPEQKGQLNQFEKEVKSARSKIQMAENFLILKKDEKAQALFQEAWDILGPLQTEEAASLKESIKQYIK